MNVRDKRYTFLWAVTALSLVVAALRLQHLITFVEWSDEIRSVWRVQFGLDNLLIRNPPDWPPTYEIILWVWARLAGSTLEVSRFLSVLISLLGAACIYQATLKLTRSVLAALLSIVVYGTLGYLIFAGVDVRAYGLLLTLGALALWETFCWLEAPTRRTGLALVVTLAALFNTSFTALPFIAFLTLYVLVMKPRQFLNWIVVGGGVFVLCIPALLQFFHSALSRVSNRLTQELPSFSDAIRKVYHDFGGSDVFVILLLIAVVLVIWLAIHQPARRRVTALLVAWLVFPGLVYLLTNNQEFMKPRYMWWVALGVILVIGVAALQLPCRIRWASLIVFLLLPLVPVDFDTYRLAVTASPPFRETFSWFASQLRPDDVLVIDPNCTCGDKFAWDYFVPQYFPTGYLPIVAHPGTAARVWYLSTVGWPRDEALLTEVEQGRKPSIFVGPWYFLLRLYEGPPSWTGVAFDDKIRLHGAEIDNNNLIMAKDETFQVKLWWSAQTPLGRDYSLSVILLNASGQIVAQVDGPASAPDTPAQTSAWQVGQYYEDYRHFHLPSDIEDGTYSLVATVYQWWDGQRLMPASDTTFMRADNFPNYILLRTITVVS